MANGVRQLMNETSRGARPVRVADQQSGSGRKKKARINKTDKRASAQLDLAVDVLNAGREGRERISNTDLGKFAETLGGIRHEQTWGEYRNGNRRIPARDKLIFALYREKPPGRVFTCFTGFTLWNVFIEVLENADPHEQALLGELLEQFSMVTVAQRQEMIARLRKLI